MRMKRFNYTKADLDSAINEINRYRYISDVIGEYEYFLQSFSMQPDSAQFPKAKEGDVIDYDMSVNWNIQEVARRIEAYNNEASRLRSMYNKISTEFDRRLQKLYAEGYNISESEARLIWNYAYNQSHSDGIEAVDDAFRELAELYESLRTERDVQAVTQKKEVIV